MHLGRRISVAILVVVILPWQNCYANSSPSPRIIEAEKLIKAKKFNEAKELLESSKFKTFYELEPSNISDQERLDELNKLLQACYATNDLNEAARTYRDIVTCIKRLSGNRSKAVQSAYATLSTIAKRAGSDRLAHISALQSKHLMDQDCKSTIQSGRCYLLISKGMDPSPRLYEDSTALDDFRAFKSAGNYDAIRNMHPNRARQFFDIQVPCALVLDAPRGDWVRVRTGADIVQSEGYLCPSEFSAWVQVPYSELKIRYEDKPKVTGLPSLSPLEVARLANNPTGGPPRPSPMPRLAPPPPPSTERLEVGPRFDFGPYRKDLIKLIAKNWNPERKNEMPVVEVSIEKSGKVLNCVIRQTSGNAQSDEYAKASIRSTTIPPLPDGYSGRFAAVKIEFEKVAAYK